MDTPLQFICPISMNIMSDPVIDHEGNTYERKSIEEWLSKNTTSPVTRNVLTKENLVPNRALQDAINEYIKLKNNPDKDMIEIEVDSDNDSDNDDSDNDDLEKEIVDKDPKIELVINSYKNYSHISIRPDESKMRAPINICCVIDVSGSMCTEVSVQDEQHQQEKNGLSQLDLVKHAIRTIVSGLNENDNFSLITFSTNASIVFELTKMNQINKQRVIAKLDELRPDGTTNLWDGIKTGIDVLSSNANANANTNTNSVMFVLTDGSPNVDPPRGYLPTIESYLKTKNAQCSINTFGFGYNLDSILLEDIAKVANGMYCFIPDGGFVGTIFVNAVANVLSSIATNCILEIEPINNTTIIESYDSIKENGKIHWNLGSITSGQSIDLVIKTENHTIETPFLNINVIYKPLYDKNINQITITRKNILYKDSNDNNGKENLDIHHQRLETIFKIREAINYGIINDFDKANENIIKIKDVLNVLLECYPNNKFVEDLLFDVATQVVQALSRQDWFKRWGKHYLLSLTRSHLKQMCNNFKDPGVQHYGGELFKKLRVELDNIFITLPAPKPSLATAKTKIVHSMRSYHNSGNVCIHPKCTVMMANQSQKEVGQIRKGDMVQTPYGPATVQYVVKSICTNNQADVIQFDSGLIITPWHPVRLNEKWMFPSAVSSIEQFKNTTTFEYIINTDSVYSFVLDKHHVMLVNYIECITLGHNFNDVVAKHPYYGTQSVLSDLRILDSNRSGLIEIKSSMLRYDSMTNMVNGIRK